MTKIKIITIQTNADKKYLQKMKSKEVTDIITRSIGTDHIDSSYAKKLKINIHSLKKYHLMATPEHYWNLLFRLIRPFNKKELGFEIAGKNILIIGSEGRVGRQLVNQSKAFYATPYCFDAMLQNTKGDLKAMLSEVDIIFIAVPLTPKTKDLFSTQMFGKMKKKPFIVNGAREGIIDLNKIEWALESDLIKGYAVDEHFSQLSKSLQK